MDLNQIREETAKALYMSCNDADEALLREALKHGQDIEFDALESFDSLAAIEVSQNLEDFFDIEIDLAYFVEATTLDAFSLRLLQIVDQTASHTQSALHEQTTVRLKEGRRDAPHLFCISGAGGHVLAFKALAAALPDAIPVYGLKLRGVDGVSTPHGSIAEIAAEYVEALRQLNPRGDIYLLGYSAGGTVAFEMAQQLEATGHVKIRLIMVDSLCPTIHSVPVTRAERMKYKEFWEPSSLAKRVADRLADFPANLRKNGSADPEQELIAAHLERGETIPHDLRERYVRDAFTLAHDAYRPSPWNGDATMIQASQKALVYKREPETLGWGPFIKGSLRCRTIETDHLSILNKPAVAQLARIVSEEMRVMV